MGFKPRSSLKDHHNIRNASFIYPDEQVTFNFYEVVLLFF